MSGTSSSQRSKWRTVFDGVHLEPLSAQKRQKYDTTTRLPTLPGQASTTSAAGPATNSYLRWRTIQDESESSESFTSTRKRRRTGQAQEEVIVVDSDSTIDGPQRPRKNGSHRKNQGNGKKAHKIISPSQSPSTAVYTISSDGEDAPTRHTNDVPEMEDDDVNGQGTAGATNKMDQAMDLDDDALGNGQVESLLNVHREKCLKCNDISAQRLQDLARLTKRKGRQRRLDEFEEDDESRVERLGGWTECTRCSAAYHYGCLGMNKRNEILAQDRKRGPAERLLRAGKLEVEKQMDIQCMHCDADLTKNCSVCREEPSTAEQSRALLFRCVECSRAMHYHHRKYSIHFYTCQSKSESKHVDTQLHLYPAGQGIHLSCHLPTGINLETTRLPGTASTVARIPRRLTS